MGKIFYARHQDKKMAMTLANRAARDYRDGICYTPAKEQECKEEGGLWVCVAAAHHWSSSCGKSEVRSGYDPKPKSREQETAGLKEEYSDAEESDYPSTSY